jgi:hypothetical protein
MHVKLHFNGLHQSGKDSAAPFASFFALHNRQAKDKVSLSLANLLYGNFITRPRGLVPPVGRDSGPSPSQGLGTPGLLPGDYRVAADVSPLQLKTILKE